jgi:RNA polymerase sigma-70 factor, ECF subfamily
MPSDPDFRALFDAHCAFVWRVLARHGVPERELPDACQEVFLVVHRRLREFEGRSSIRTWLYGIAVRVALGMRRRVHHTREELGDVGHEEGVEPEQEHTLSRRRQLELVGVALEALPAEQREVFALYELEGMSMAEVAVALGVPENTALYRLHAARDAIKRVFARAELGSMPRKAWGA